MSILLDLRTGDPILENGDYVRVSDKDAFKQVIDRLLFCQVGTEILNRNYGFDLQTAVTLNTQGASPEFIESLLVEALDPNKERLIRSVDSIEAERDGASGMNVSFAVTNKMGTTITLKETIYNAL